jgi:cystathionine gamma-lyase
MEFETKAIHVGEEPNLDRGSGDVVVPIHLSSTFARKKVNEPTQGYE